QTGGGQEKGRRTGTENVAGVVGLGVAMRIARERQTSESGRQSRLRDRIIAGVTGRIEDAVLTGHPTRRLPNNASFCIAGTEGESLIVGLDLEGFAVSSGSACTAGETERAAVFLSLGLMVRSVEELAHRKTEDQAWMIDVAAIKRAMVAVSPESERCAVTAVGALRSALVDARVRARVEGVKR